MAFQLTRLNVPNLTTDYSAETQAAARLGQTLGNLIPNIQKQRKEEAEREEMARIGKGIAEGTLDFNKAAGGLATLGRIDSAVDLLKMGETAKARGLSEAATRGLSEALGGGSLLGAPSTTPSKASTTSPASLVNNESGGRWNAQNDAVGAGGQRGHFGRIQFGHARLEEAKAAGAIPAGTTVQAFMASPELQQSAERWHWNDIDGFIAQNGLDRAIGQPIGGVPATVDGMRAVAHLGGKEGLRKFIATGGQYNPADENGTSLMDYFSRHGGQRTRVAEGDPDMPAQGSTPAAMESGRSGFSVPGTPAAMTGRTFDAITGDQALDPAFQSEGTNQPWMGSALRQPIPTPQGQTAIVAQQPPRRPAMLGQITPADIPAADAVPAIGQMPPALIEDLSNAPDGGSRAFAASQGRIATAAPTLANPAPRSTSGAVPFSANSAAPATDANNQRADLPAVGATPTQGQGVTPVLSSEMPRPTNAQEYREVVTTRQMEGNKGQIGKLAAALANPNLPANARAVGEIFLKEALEASKAPDSVKEFVYAKSMGWTTAKNLAEYHKERQGNDNTPSIKEYEYAKRGGFTGSLLDFEREKAASKAKPGLSAADQKAIFAAEDVLPVIDGTIETLKRARELNDQTHTGITAGIAGRVGTSGVWGSGLLVDEQKAKATREFGQIMSFEAIKSMSALLKGATTEREMSEFQRLLGDPSTPPDLRARTIDRMLTLAERQKGIAQGRIEELRSKAGIQPPQGQPRQQAAPQGQQRQPDASQARQAPDGNFYVPDPNRPGKYMQVQP